MSLRSQDAGAPGEIDPKIYDAYLGRYDLGSNRVITVIRDGDRLLAQLTGEEYVEVRPKSEGSFVYRGSNRRLTFVKDDKGAVSEVTLFDRDEESSAKKLPESADKPKDDGWVDKSPHVEASVTNWIKLSYLDWGGEGSTMLFLAGLGNSAHIFDEFAPRFTNQFHVIGLTRRGYGKSDKPDIGYDVGTRAEDVHQFITKLRLKRVILVGHSIAGDELTRMAERFPESVEKLVYLDAAYDRSAQKSLLSKMPPDPKPSDRDRASFAAFIPWCKTHWPAWSEATEADLRQTRLLTPDGYAVQGSTPNNIPGVIIRGSLEYHPDYSKVSAPALAIYTFDSHAMEKWEALMPEATVEARKKEEEFLKLLDESRYQEIERFRKGVKNGKVVEMQDTVHHCFIQQPDEVEKEMRTFLTGMPKDN